MRLHSKQISTDFHFQGRQDLSLSAAKYDEIEHAQKAFAQIDKVKDILIKELPTNRELLNKLSSYSFTKV